MIKFASCKQFSLLMAEQELRTYYNYLYPFSTITRWLSYDDSKDSPLMHRELSFQYESVGVERYVVFADPAAMKDRMIDSRLRTPVKVDAGAVWTRRPEKDSTAKTVERELIFDFDMNDYDDVRTCCTGKKVCVKCWQLLVVAVEILEQALAEDFDYHKLLFVFSGGRGLHIWVCDKKARKLQDFVRKGVVDYLELVTGNDKAASLLGENVIGKVEDSHLWKHKIDDTSRREVREFYLENYVSEPVRRALEILSKHFIKILDEQAIFAVDEKGEFIHGRCLEIMLRVVAHRSKEMRERVADRWRRGRGQSARDMLALIDIEVARYEKSLTLDDYNAERPPGERVQRLAFIEEEIMLSFLYPRMDYNVSTMQNHLLKLPFSVHPSSRKISIPLTRKEVTTFNPQNCITINSLLDNLDYNDLQSENQQNAERAGLKWPIQALEQFTKSVISEK